VSQIRISFQILVFLVLFFSPLTLFSTEIDVKDEEQEHATHEEEDKKGFDPGSFIFGHIADAYDWHILSIKDLHLSIPLPVIVYSKTSGLHCFLSSKFHHGHSAYKGFEIAHSGEYEGKVVETMEDGSQVKPLDLSISKNVFAAFISLALMLWIFISIARSYKKRVGKAPKGMQNFVEPIILFIRDEVAKPSIGEKNYERYMPYLLTLFFFIWINNMMGLIPIFPGGANVTGNIVNAIETGDTPKPNPACMSPKMKIRLKKPRAMICPAVIFANRRTINTNGFVSIPIISITGIKGIGSFNHHGTPGAFIISCQ